MEFLLRSRLMIHGKADTDDLPLAIVQLPELVKHIWRNRVNFVFSYRGYFERL
jgi:hypothetical protein